MGFNKISIIFCVLLFFTVGVQAQGEKPFVYDDHGRRDPFWSLVTSGGAVVNYGSDIMISDMILEGIIAGVDGKNIAIINGAVVGEEDKIGLFTIKAIEQDKVVLVKEGEDFILKLKKEE